jgi:exodeoxyribonuclease VII large subunit
MTEAYNVKFLANYIKNHIDLIGSEYIWIEGEIQNYRLSSRHQYFTLNEGNTSIKAIIWDSIYKSMNIKLKNGLFGKFYGKINYYKNKNEISVNIYKIDLEKEVGEIYRLYEENQLKCEELGYFTEKKNLPKFYKNIAIITRYESAAYNDILNILKESLSMNIYIYDSGMQGESSIKDITQAITVLNKVKSKLKLDCIILTRGGGSIDDLWIFNHMSILKSIYDSNVPIFTGIGHDIDYSLSDKISDKSFITPTDIGRYIENNWSKKQLSDKLITDCDMVRDKMDIIIENHLNDIKDIIDDLSPEFLLEKFQNEEISIKEKRESVRRKFSSLILSKENELENILLNIKKTINDRNSIKLFKKGIEIMEDSKIVLGSKLDLMFNNKSFKIKVLSIN